MPRKKAKKKSRIKALLNFTMHLIWSVGSIAILLLGIVDQNWPIVGGAILLLVFYIPYNEKWRKWILRK